MQVASRLHEYVWSYLHPTPSKRPDAIKLGVLVENAELNPVTIIYPSATHPSTILHALSTPNPQTYKTLSQKYKQYFTRTYTSHDSLLQDPDITAVYICAPIATRYVLAKQALNTGKHVLCESPVAGNAEGVRDVHRLAGEKGVVLLDGPHWQFHPAAHAWRKIVDTREYGRLLRTETVVSCMLSMPLSDPAWDFDAAGGSFITHSSAHSSALFALHATLPTQILSSTAHPSPSDPRIDTSLTTHLLFKDPSSNTVSSKITTSLSHPYTLTPSIITRIWDAPSITVETDYAVLYFYNFTQPHVYHYISVLDKRSEEVSYRKCYKGGPLWGGRVVSTGEKGGRAGWSSWRWRLEGFMDVLQGRTPVFWVSGVESGWLAEGVDGVYCRAGLGRRVDSGQV